MDSSTREFIRALLAASGVSRSGDEFCKQLVHRVAPGCGVIAALIAKVTDDSKIRIFGQYGPWAMPSETSIVDIWGTSPISQAIRFKRVIAVSASDLPNSNSVSPQIVGAQSYLYLPFDEDPRSIGVLALAFISDESGQSFEGCELELLGVAAEYFTTRASIYAGGQQQANSSIAVTIPEDVAVIFSEREKQILIQMSEGKTNYQIGRKLNLAESTIKQESVRIFKKLGVKKRSDAWVIARQLEII